MQIKTETKRFLQIVDLIIHKRLVKNDKALTKKLKISSSSISEMRRERTNVGMKPLRAICREFNVSEEWILKGEGEMFLDDGRYHGNHSELKSVDEIVREVSLVKREVDVLQREIDVLKRQIIFRQNDKQHKSK